MITLNKEKAGKQKKKVLTRVTKKKSGGSGSKTVLVIYYWIEKRKWDQGYTHSPRLRKSVEWPFMPLWLMKIHDRIFKMTSLAIAPKKTLC